MLSSDSCFGGIIVGACNMRTRRHYCYSQRFGFVSMQKRASQACSQRKQIYIIIIYIIANESVTLIEPKSVCSQITSKGSSFSGNKDISSNVNKAAVITVRVVRVVRVVRAVGILVAAVVNAINIPFIVNVAV